MLLLYCMTQDAAVPSSCAQLRGVGDAEVSNVAKNGVRYFYSEWDPGKTASEVKQDVLKVHQVIQALFEHTTVIPFRFPTSVADEAALMELIEATSSEYAEEFARLGDSVQVRVKVTAPAVEAPVAPATSGTEYLKQRQRSASPANDTLKRIMDAAAPLILEHKRSNRADSIVLYLLLQRDRQEELKRSFALLTDLPAAVTISGPWPPSDFVNCYPEFPQSQEPE